MSSPSLSASTGASAYTTVRATMYLLDSRTPSLVASPTAAHTPVCSLESSVVAFLLGSVTAILVMVAAVLLSRKVVACRPLAELQCITYPAKVAIAVDVAAGAPQKNDDSEAFDRLVADLAAARAERDQLHASLDRSNADLSLAVAHAEESARAVSRDELIRLKALVVSSEDARKAAEAEADRLRVESFQRASSHAAEIAKAFAEQAAESETRAAALSEALSQARTEVDVARREAADEHAALNDARKGLDAARATVDAMRTTMDARTKKLTARLDTAHNSMDAALTALRAEADAAIERERSVKEMDLREAHERDVDRDRRVAAATATAAALLASVEELRAESVRERAVISEQSEDIAQLRAESQRREAAMSDQSEEISRLRAELERAAAAAKEADEYARQRDELHKVSEEELRGELASIRKTRLEKQFKEEKLPDFVSRLSGLSGTVKHGGRTVAVRDA